MSPSTEPIAAAWARRSGLPPDRIVGSREIGEMIGLTRQRIGQLRRADPWFPRSVTTISGGPLWYRAGIEAWAALHRPETPAAARGRFGDEAVRTLRAAETAARNHGHDFLADFHLWLAFLASDPPDAVVGVLHTMGADRPRLRRAIPRFAMGGVGPSPAQRMNPFVQDVLERAAGAAAAGGRKISAADIAVGLIDIGRRRDGRRHSSFLDLFERRGLDVAELRRRLVVAAGDPGATHGFERRQLDRRSRAVPRRRWPPPIRIAPNPLGRDPWSGSVGAAFAMRQDGRSLVVDGEQWFFRTDADGFYIRTPDGFPVGYRYRIDPPPRPEDGDPAPVNGLYEVLPMPPSDVAYWPDGRFRRE